MLFPDNFDVDPTTPRPLILVLHGYGGNGPSTKTTLGFDDLHNRGAGYFVLAPDAKVDGTSGFRYWNASLACCDDNGEGTNDVGYLGGILDYVILTWPVDVDRVCIAGVSNGAFMAQRLGYEREDIVISIMAHHGALGSAAETSITVSPRVNVLLSQGTADATVPYAGGPVSVVTMADAVAVEGAGGSVESWATALGASGSLQANSGSLNLFSTAGDETEVRDYSGAQTNGALRLLKSVGTGHIGTFVASSGDVITTEWGVLAIDWCVNHPRI